MSDQRPSRSGVGIRQVQNRRAACDDCPWEGQTPTDASRHHVATGHNCHAGLTVNYFYGDPMASFMRNHGMTPSEREA